MKPFKCEGCNNLAREFAELLMMLQSKYPDAFMYYLQHLKKVDGPNKNG